MAKPESRIAIIGMACRFPGGADNPESLWSMLAEGRDGRKEVPKDRWNWKSFYNQNPETKDSTNYSHGYFLDEDVAAFDARFFGIPGADAGTIDPQQRLLLEVTYEALENAGLPIEDLRGSDTSVHMAMFARDYDRMGYKDVSELDTGHIIGTGEAILANRISYVLDLKGSSYTVDTGCSGGLVVLHQACQTLRAGESTVALAGASQLLLSPDQSIAMSQLTNKDGRCFTFDDRGSGYARGEGLGVLVLKRLDQAIADGDHVHAVMLESGVGHDGKTAGIFLPNGDAQEALARSVYARAGLDPRETLYVESHGTGTVAGDNAEVRSIARVFGREAGRASDVPVGSIKTNVGHLEAASGMAGAIKAIMILKKHQIPPQLNFINPKSTLRLKERGIKVPLDLTPLTPQGHTGPRRVSVNSFGYGGTNAHAILEAYDPQPLPVNGYVNGNGHFQGNGQHVNGNGYHADESEHSFHGNGHHVNGINLDNDQGAEPKLITLSANSESSLTKVVSNLRRWLASEQAQAASLDDLAFTLNTRRSKLPWRCTVISSNFEELQEVLGDSKLHPKKSARDAVLAFIFTGQGAQWHAMGRELLIGSESREFASAIAFCNKAIKDLGCEWDLFEELSRDKESSRLGDARFSQPITTAVQIALVDLLANTYRIRPQAVCGHSSGEIAAAYAAGALTRESAMRVAFMRGICSAMAKTMNATPGGMVAVGEGEDAINTRIRQLSSGKGKVTVACVNSPESTTISGDLAAILELEAALGAASVFHRRLKVDSAYHSHHMEVVAPLYLSLLDGITHDTPREDVAFYSSVTGKRKGSGFGPSYWTSNLVSQVKFSAASQLVAQHLSDTHSTAAALLIEIGPHAALSGPLRQSLSDSNFKLASGASFKFNYASCLIRNTNAVRTILALVGKVFESGSPLRLDGGASRKEAICQRQVVSNLPPYPWDHSHKYWRESRLSKGNRLRPFPPHDLLGLLEVNSSPYEPRWRHHVSLARIPWLRDHVIEGFVIFPGAGYLVMVIEAMKQLFQLRKMSGRITNINIRDTVIAKPVVIHDDRTKGAQEVELQLIISPSRQYNGSPWEHFRIVSYDSQNDCWIDNCSGLVSWESVVAGTATLQSQADENASAQDDGLGHLTGAAAEQWLQEVQAACPNFVDAAETYREMKASGNEYGDTFQGLKEIHYGKGHATGRIVIPDIERHIPGHYMQPHTIHPSTFDSIFQLEPVCFRREGLVAPIMPTVLGEISVAVDMDSTAGSELLVAIKHFQQSRRDSAFSYCAYQKRRDGFLRPVITGTELRTQVVGEATSDPVSQKKMTYLMEWKPDVDFITQDDLMFHASGQDLVDESYESTTASKLLGNGGVFGRLYSEYPFFKSHYPQVLRYVQALVHKNPNLKILLASSETEAISRPLTDTIGKLSAHIDIKTLDASRDPIQQGYSAYSFDLIVAVFLSRAVPSIDATMAYMQKLMKPRGRLVLLETTGSSAAQDDSFCASNGLCASGDKLQDRPLISLSDWDGLLKHHGFSGTDLVVPAHKDTSHDSSTMMVTHVLPIAAETTHRHAENVNQRMLTAQVHLGFSEDVSQAALGAAICRSLCDRGIECSRQDWDTTSHGPRDITIVIDSAEHPLLMDPSLKTFERFKRLLLQGGNIIWVGFQTSPPTGDKTALKNMASGMARVLRRENPSLRLVTVDIQDPIQLGSISQRIIQMLAAIVKRSFPLPDGNGTLESEFENEYAICNGRICIPRIIPDHTLSKHIETRNPNQNTKDDASLVNCQYLDVTRPLKFDIQVPGLLKTIRFVDNDDMSGPLGVDEVQIQARAYGINFKDVLIALGQMAPGTTMTGEVAGVITAVGSDVQSWKVGDRVTAFFVTPFGNQVRVKGKHVVGIPDSVSFANAASIPLVYFTAWYCLNHVARLEKSQSVLIHAGSGGVGQSAIQLAQMTGAEVYTTVGSAAKKKLLQEQYGIPDSHIFSSHPGKFKKQILDATKGTGLDVVLNSLSGQSLRDSWDCLAPFGTFCEIGKADIVGRSQLSMAKFDKQATFASVDVYYMHRMRPEVVVRGIRDIFAMVDKGLLKPVFPVTTFDMSRMEEAFRLMAERKHMGKLVLVANEQTIVQAPMPKAPDLKLKRDATYIIGGGLGDLGKRIGCFLAEKEAGHVVALTRRDADAVAKQPAVVEVQKSISRSGGTLHIIQCDIGDEMSTRSAAEKLSELRLPPIRGVIQGATVLRDHPFEYMELAHWTDSVRPKVQGTINMHEAFCSPETTEFFVMLSSVASIVGSASQSNYAAGNAFLDAFAHAGNQSSRVVTRYSTINIGAIAGSELVNGVLEQGIDITETIGSVSFSEVLAALEYAMNPKARENHTVSQHIMHFNRDAMEAAIGPSALSDPMFDHVPSKMREGKTTNSADTKKQSVLEAVKQSRTISEAEEIVRQALLEKFIAFIGDDVADVPISTLGLDSLVSIELKNWVKHTFRTPLQISELTGAPSILALAKVIVSRMSLEFSKVNGVGSDHGNAKQESGSATVETESDMDPPSITSGVDTASNSAGHGQDCCKRYEELTVQPLPDLDDTLDYWLEANEHLFSPQQLKSIHQDFQTMRAPNSPARQILQDLYDTHRDDKTNAWFADVVTKARFLCRRAPVAPWTSIMAAQRDGPGKRHSQAERAAIITSAALSYRQAMNAGKVEPLEIGGRPECTWGWKWLFNSTRVPQLGCDKVVSYAPSPNDWNTRDHIAVLRKGRVFKVMLQDADGQDMPLHRLQAIFEAILARVEGDDLLSGLLTTDERDSWAKVREALLALSPSNAEYFRAIDSAMFVLCLDSGSPNTPDEIARQGYIGNGENRWFDKVVQFYVSANGRSGLITEHGILDGTTSTRLLEWIADAMEAHPANSADRNGQLNEFHPPSEIELKELVLQVTPDIEGHAAVLRERYQQATSTSTYVREYLSEFGTDFLLQSRVPVKGAIDLTFQLALRFFFGQNMASWEPTSGALYHAGRADALQRATPAVNQFCDAVAKVHQAQDNYNDRVTTIKLKNLLLAASKSMNASMQTLLTGRSSQRVFEVLAYLWPVNTDTPKPAFLSEMVFFSRPSPPIFAQTTSFEGKMTVDDFVHIMPDPEGFWAFMCPEKNKISISLTGGSEERAAAFVKELHRAARIMRDIVGDHA